MRIAIVNDMPLAIEALKRSILQVPGYELAWTAVNGEEAVQFCLRDRPVAGLGKEVPFRRAV